METGIWLQVEAARFLRQRNRDTVVGIRTRLRDVRSGRLFSSSHFPDGLRGSPNLLFNGCLGSFPGVKLPGRDFDHSPPHCAEVKNEWVCTSALPIRLHGFERENSTSYLRDRLWNPPRLMPSGYNEPRVLYPGIEWIGTAVNLMQKVDEERGNTCIAI